MANSSNEENEIDYEGDEVCHKEYVAQVGSIAVPLFFSLVVLLSLVGNVLVLVILALYESLKSLTNIFILNLAVSDLIFTAGLPFWSFQFIWGWTFGKIMCNGVSFVFSAGFYSSTVFLMVMTLQRYLAVVHPLSDWETGSSLAVLPILAWVISIGAALPALFQTSVVQDHDNHNISYCLYSSNNAIIAATYQQNVFFVLAFSLIAFCYIRILQTVLNSRARKRHRTVRLIFCIVMVFFIGWAPYNIVIFLQTLKFYFIAAFTDCTVSDNLDYALYACRLLAFSHCCLNPVFYVFVGVKFRNHLKVILQLFRPQINTDPQRVRVATVQGSKGSMY
ncbi:chemokine XC receptor 1-like [Astyanax mexicanus]|uniref:chemokine XC receptor 1-like n=1 Tax=Astyanax mexicanus TaxID=7994 RepID=UPI0020CAC7B3|nr:chemokine XC receptor 1-like [Astyanax mexicanus]